MVLAQRNSNGKDQEFEYNFLIIYNKSIFGPCEKNQDNFIEYRNLSIVSIFKNLVQIMKFIFVISIALSTKIDPFACIKGK